MPRRRQFTNETDAPLYLVTRTTMRGTFAASGDGGWELFTAASRSAADDEVNAYERMGYTDMEVTVVGPGCTFILDTLMVP